MMTVRVHIDMQSQPVVRENVVNAYQKGDMYCLYLDNGVVEKYPLSSIFRISEDY